MGIIWEQHEAARRFALTGLSETRSNLLLRDIFPWRRHNELTHQRPGAAIEHMKAAGFVSPLCQKWVFACWYLGQSFFMDTWRHTHLCKQREKISMKTCLNGINVPKGNTGVAEFVANVATMLPLNSKSTNKSWKSMSVCIVIWKKNHYASYLCMWPRSGEHCSDYYQFL